VFSCCGSSIYVMFLQLTVSFCQDISLALLEEGIVKFGKLCIMATATTAVFFLHGYYGKVLGLQDMACGPGPHAAAGVKTCQTMETKPEVVQVSCEMGSAAKKASPVYICAPTIRDWGHPASYAHTSHIWRCKSGVTEIFLFAQDFSQDSVRCNLLCGHCDTGWHDAP